MKKKLLALVLAAVACFAIVGCGAATDEASTDEGADTTAKAATDITVGYWGGTCEMALYTAVNYGYFEEQGLNVDTIQIGYSDVAELLASDGMDVYLCTPTDIMSMKNGYPVYFIDSMHTGCFEGVATQESGITTIADLPGKTIAVDMIGSVAYVQICSEMVRQGLSDNPAEDINWVVYDTASMQAAFDNGEIDGYCTSDVMVETCVRDYNGVRFFSDTYDEYLKDTLCCFIGCDSTLVDEHPEVAEAIAAAIKSACEQIEANPQECVEKAISAGFLTTDDVELAVSLTESYTWLAGDEARYQESFEEHLWENYRAGLLDDAVDLSEEEFETYIDDFIAAHGRYSGQ